jgi:hypothetical protein
MTKLNRSTTGAYVARKVIPKDVRSDYAARHGVAWEEKFYLAPSVSGHEADRPPRSGPIGMLV